MVFFHLNIFTSRVKCAAFHQKRPWVAVACHDGHVEIWDYIVNALVDRIKAHSSPVRCIDFHPTQPLFVTGGDDCLVKLWSLTDRALLHTFSGHFDYLRSVFFHPGAKPLILSSSDDGTARIWNWQSRQRVADLIGHREFVMCARWHPTEDLVATASMDSTVRVWDVSNAQQRAPVGKLQQMAINALSLPHTVISTSVSGTGHSRGVNWLAWVPEEKNGLITASDDGTLKVWKLNRGGAAAGKALVGADAVLYCTATMTGHTNNVSSVAYSVRNTIISNSIDGTMRFYEAKNRIFIGDLTVKDALALCARTTTTEESFVGQTQNRWWSLAEHPQMDLWAAGHDNGLLIFSNQSETPVYTRPAPPAAPSGLQGQPGQRDGPRRTYFVSGHKLLSTDLLRKGDAGSVSGARTLLPLTKHTARAGAFGAGTVICDPVSLLVLATPFPFLVTYNDGRNTFMAIYASEKDCTGKNKPRTLDVDCAPVRVSRSNVAWLVHRKDGSYLQTAFIGVGGATLGSRYAVPPRSVSLVESPRPQEVLLVLADHVCVLSLPPADASASASSAVSAAGAAEAAEAGGDASLLQPVVRGSHAFTAPVLGGAFSDDGVYVALHTASSVYILASETLRVVATASSYAPINSLCWGIIGRGMDADADADADAGPGPAPGDALPRPRHALVYSTSTHINYLLPNETATEGRRAVHGVLTSLNRQIYLLAVSGQTVFYIDHYDDVHTIEFDSRVSGFFNALTSGRKADTDLMAARLRQADYHEGVAIPARLVQAGFDDVALRFVPEASAALKNRLAVDMGVLGSLNLDEGTHDWVKITHEALLQAQGSLALEAARRSGRIDLFAYVASLYGVDVGLGCAELRALFPQADAQAAINAALLLGDSELLCGALVDAGLPNAARVHAQANGLARVLRRLDDANAGAAAGAKTSTQLTVGRARRPIKRATAAESILNWPLAIESEFTFTSMPSLPQDAASVENKRYTNWLDDENDESSADEAKGGRCRAAASKAAWNSESDSERAENVEHASGSPAKPSRTAGSFSAPEPRSNPLVAHPLLLNDKGAASEFLARRNLKASGALKVLRPTISTLQSMNRTAADACVVPFVNVRAPLTSKLIFPHTPENLAAIFDGALDKVTEGAFADASDMFVRGLRLSLLYLACTENPSAAQERTEGEARSHVLNAAIYIPALAAEIERRAGDGLQDARACELSVLFAIQAMKPRHSALALRSGMARTKKLGAYSHCRALAKRFVALANLKESADLEEVTEGLPKARKMMSLADEDTCSLSFSADEYDTVRLCSATMKGFKGKASTCSACGAIATSNMAQKECVVCSLGLLE